MAEQDNYRYWVRTAKNIQQDVDATGLGRLPQSLDYGDGSQRSLLEQFDDRVTNISLCAASRKLFADGHFARAVEEAFKCLNNAVKDKSGITDRDGADLMRRAFSSNFPVLTLNAFQSRSEKDEQQGYMDIFAGSMTGIRNPRAHENDLVDEPEVALELLAIANHLMRRLDETTSKEMPSTEGSPHTL